MRILKVAIAVLVIGQVACTRHADPLKAALSSGRWESVLTDNGGHLASPASGFLRAQTFLAANRNGEAVCEFLKEDAPALEQYQTMTRRFADRYPKSAVAQYLVGDALARYSKWGDAVVSFDRALSLDQGFALARVARGVALISSGKLKDGKRDLYSALMADPKSAEAQAAMGWTLLKEGQPAATARTYFETAVKLSPGYSLAVAGKGYAEVAAGDAEKGADDVTGQLKPGNCEAALLAENSLLAASWIRTGGAPVPEDEPGTVIAVVAVMEESMIKNTIRQAASGNQRDVDNLAHIFAASSNNPYLKKTLADAFKVMTPATRANFVSDLEAKDIALRPGGSVDRLTDQTRFVLKGLDTAAVGRLPVPPPVRLALTKWSTNMVDTPFRDLEVDLHHYDLGVKNILGTVKPMMSATPPRTPPAGATTSLTGARRDEGNWPFQPIFGLLYPRS